MSSSSVRGRLESRPSGTTPRLYYAFGFCGHGFQLAPGVGLVMSELFANGATQTPLGSFAITRFASAGQAAAKSLAHEFDSSLVPPRS
jgi:sarcosine oxidase, subunit beta